MLFDEYAQQEQDDGVELIAWLAAQPWCNGAVGMMGISWGGFNGLQIAARRPPALKAIVTSARQRIKDYKPIDEADRIDDWLYLPEVLYAFMLIVVISAGAGPYSLDALVLGLIDKHGA